MVLTLLLVTLLFDVGVTANRPTQGSALEPFAVEIAATHHIIVYLLG
jgi:hypothetical protein